MSGKCYASLVYGFCVSEIVRAVRNKANDNVSLIVKVATLLVGVLRASDLQYQYVESPTHLRGFGHNLRSAPVLRRGLVFRLSGSANQC